MSIYTNDRVNDHSKRYKEYVKKIEGGTSDGSPAYQYYKFATSPDAIMLMEIGRCLSRDILALKSASDSHVLWKPMSGVNTPEGWKMQIGQKLSEMKRGDMGLSSAYNSNIKTTNPGLKCRITLISSNPDEKDNEYVSNLTELGITSNSVFLDASVDRQYDKSVAWIDRFSSSSKISFETETTDFSNYKSLFTIPSDKPDLNKHAVGIEWSGFFKPTVLGEYKFTISSGSGYCLLWIGNKAICEYIRENADINIQTNPFTIVVSEERYYPIRIQYYADSDNSPKNPRLFSFTITNTSTLSQLDLKTCLYTINDGSYLPKLVYCAFVSRSLENFRYGKFDCYTMDMENESKADCDKFYEFMNSQKYNFAKKQYDYDKVSGVMQYGTLKDGNTYTDVSVANNPNSMPVVFSINRVDSDIRMGKAFQIKTQKQIVGGVQIPYEMIAMDIKFNKGSSYDVLPNYYPDNPASGAPVTGPNECKKKCNDLPDCNFYYTYKSNNVPRCLVGTTDKNPTFTQIRPIGPDALTSVDENTSTLNIRTFNFPKVEGCGANAVFVNSEQDVKNTVDYTNSFAYSNYTLASTPITTHKAVGKCADSEFLGLENEARNILYSKTKYQSGGEYLHPDGSMRRANYPSSDDRNFWDSIKLQPEGMRNRLEGMDTKNTQAVLDTQDAIAAVKAKDVRFAATQIGINKNLYDLSNNDIPLYLEQRTKMNNNVNSDLSGNVLLYFRNQRIPTLREQTAFDANESGFMQNSLYVLGTMTAVSLLILAVLIARE